MYTCGCVIRFVFHVLQLLLITLTRVALANL